MQRSYRLLLRAVHSTGSRARSGSERRQLIVVAQRWIHRFERPVPSKSSTRVQRSPAVPNSTGFSHAIMTAAAAVAAEAPATQRVTTRLATLDDVAFLKPIISTAYAGDRNWTNQSAVIQDERVTIDELHAIVKRGTDPIVVAEVDGQVVGCVQIEFCRDHPELRLPDDAALLGMLAMHHEYESMGIGSMLGRAAFAVAAHNNCHRAMLLLVNKRTDLQATYERKGFRFTGETRPFTFGGRVLQDDVYFLVYELALTPTQ